MSARRGSRPTVGVPKAGLRVALMFVLAVAYAACFVLIKAGSRFAPSLAFAGLRTVIAGAALLGLVVALRQPVVPPRGVWRWIAVLAFTSTAGAYGAMFLSPGRAGAGVASVLGNLQPIFVIGLAAPLLGERISRRSWMTLALGSLGAVSIAAPGLGGGSAYGVSGPAMALAASLGFAAGSVLVKRLNPPSGLLVLAGWQLLIGGVPLLVASAVVERETPIVWSGRFVVVLLALALGGTSLTTAVWYWLLRDGDLGRLIVFFYLVPVFGLVLSLAVYGESIGQVEAVGIALVLAAVGLVVAGALGGDPAG